ncbi:hypothetical protein D1013_02815 [Euzebyella marina]|uniref:Uncharacterized protein n=1 Tax=Euzebyella marina TaxID=1761453 RepID=A0A3G2L287_9FLAO|nr:hypothetical protein [Euzebyella marina]AYN66387.1 hypothetical protein D1013_02815 [Euzebyella marina]
MENSKLRGRILMEMENLLAREVPKQKVPQKLENLHKDLLKKHYNAAEVSIDYHRRRVELAIVMNDGDYDPKKINLTLPTLHTNLWFRNLYDFMKSCLEKDPKSIAFYATLLRAYQGNEKRMALQ